MNVQYILDKMGSHLVPCCEKCWPKFPFVRIPIFTVLSLFSVFRFPFSNLTKPSRSAVACFPANEASTQQKQFSCKLPKFEKQKRRIPKLFVKNCKAMFLKTVVTRAHFLIVCEPSSQFLNLPLDPHATSFSNTFVGLVHCESFQFVKRISHFRPSWV